MTGFVGTLGPVWIYLQTTPLFGLASTLLAWQVAVFVSGRLRGHALVNPMLLAVLMLAALLLLTGMPYDAYFAGGQYVQVLLGPATVALAVPLHDNLPAVRRSARALLPAILAGSAVTATSAMLIARWLGAPRPVVLALGAKSVTTPIAMGIAEQLGGLPSLTAVFVLITGLCGVVMMGPVMRGLRITDWRAYGLGAGTAAHGLATARVLLMNDTAGAFSGLAIGVNGIVTSLILPLLAALLGG